MKRTFLYVFLILALGFWASQHYALKMGKSSDGAFRVVLVDKDAGKVIPLIGK